jgi:predicted secreted protein
VLSITKDSSGKEIELTVGESFEVQLPEKRTAGYKWKEVPSSPSILTLQRVREDNSPRSPEGGFIAGGEHVGRWIGHAIREGTVILELQYRGPTQQTTDTFKITLRVTPQ